MKEWVAAIAGGILILLLRFPIPRQGASSSSIYANRDWPLTLMIACIVLIAAYLLYTWDKDLPP